LLTLFFRLDLGTAFFAFESALHTLKYFLDSQNFSPFYDFSFFFLCVLKFFIKLDDIRHDLKLL
jgi:hypothetical protein